MPRVVCSRAQHETALSIYVHELHDDKAAADYCAQVHDTCGRPRVALRRVVGEHASQWVGLPLRSAPDVYIALLHAYISRPPR